MELIPVIFMLSGAISFLAGKTKQQFWAVLILNIMIGWIVVWAI